MSTAKPPSKQPTQRRQETLKRIIDAAWLLSREAGLQGWSLRDLGAQVGMRAPSLYEYAASKNALTDLMFADGYRQLIERIDKEKRPNDPRKLLRVAARLFIGFANEDPVRFQLLFQHTIPGFHPSDASMQLAVEARDAFADVLAQAGVKTERELDLWTAVLTGLASQQVANDPGGDRWLKLVNTAVDRLYEPS